MATYTGSDVRVIIELASPGAGAPRFSKQLLEVTTLTVSCHRVKTPAVACGYINPKGFARGRRTIAGTLALTKFTTEVLMRFLHAGYTRSYRPVAQQEPRAHARRSRTRSFFMDNAQRPSSTIMVASLAARARHSAPLVRELAGLARCWPDTLGGVELARIA